MRLAHENVVYLKEYFQEVNKVCLRRGVKARAVILSESRRRHACPEQTTCLASDGVPASIVTDV